MANFPTTLPSISNPSGTDYLNSPAHATLHGSVNDEVTAVATKIGTGASTPALGQVLKGTGTGTSAWANANRAVGFFIVGTASVANDLSWNPIVPEAFTAVKTWAYARTAPTGATLIVSIYNVTQAAVVGTVSITAGNQTGNSTSYTTASIAQGDVLRCDVTQIGSTIAGADISVVLECS